MILFPFSDYWWFYIGFVVLVLILISIDLGLFQKSPHAISPKQAMLRTSIWISLALIFNIGLYFYTYWVFSNHEPFISMVNFDAPAMARKIAMEFLTGYVVEQSLSIDNIFVFVVVFMYFKIPQEFQHRVLFYGILGALILRGIFVALGALLMQFHFVVWLFGGFLIFTGLQMMFGPDKEIEPEKNLVLKILKKFIPVTHSIDGRSFFLKIDGRWHMTPLFVALIFLEMTDVVFAVDSVPAIFAITKEPLVVFTSNIFAILGLRSLYFLLASLLDLFHLLKYGLSLVLIFVGTKMIWLDKQFENGFPTALSLAIICGLIFGSVVISLAFPAKSEAKESN